MTTNQNELRLLRRKLLSDAERAHGENGGAFCTEWIDPASWSEYMGPQGRALYESFTDEELLDILRLTAEKLGRLPSRKEVFCVYRSFLCRRFTNWPTALRAAGLKPPKTRNTRK